MKKIFILFTVLISLFWYLLPVCSEEKASERKTDEVFAPFEAAFKNPTRPYVTFDHDQHIELTNNSCVSCHHTYVDGRLTTEDSSDEPCSSCHPKDNPKGTNLVMAYHKQCRGCHKLQTGPVACGQCHVKR